MAVSEFELEPHCPLYFSVVQVSTIETAKLIKQKMLFLKTSQFKTVSNGMTDHSTERANIKKVTLLVSSVTPVSKSFTVQAWNTLVGMAMSITGQTTQR